MTYQPPSTCSGSGACNQTSAETCGLYVCGTNGACRTTCAADGHCVAGYYCAGTTCAPTKGLGEQCNAGPECTSGSCVDGVCCFTGSCPTCQACNINGVGTCAPVASGPEPHNRCTPSPPCGNTGTCTGGACTQGSASTPCGLPQSCGGMTYQPPSTCSGTGSCNQAGTETCGLYVCDTNNTCRQACGDDSHCIGGTFCAGTGACEPKRGLGDGCGRDGECTSTYCTEGFCCEQDVCPMCQSCALGAMRGTCTQVGAGQPDPSLTCVDMTPASCGTNGLCNAGGTCDRYDTNTECATSCDSTDITRTYCDTTGTCGGLSIVDPCPFGCNIATNMCLPPI
jgi:hypothetical protein